MNLASEFINVHFYANMLLYASMRFAYRVWGFCLYYNIKE